MAYGYFSPYYGATYYLAYNPHNIYGAGTACYSSGACISYYNTMHAPPGGGIVGTLVALICICGIIACVYCAIASANKGEIHEELIVHHDPGTGLPPIEIA